MEKLHAQLRELKKKHSRELAECQAKVEAAEAKIRDLEEQLDAQERKHKTMKLEATVEALKEQLAAFKKAAHVAVATPAGTTYTATPRSQTPLVPAMPASATASKTTPYDPARPGGLVPTTTPTPYDPARPGGAPPTPMSVQMVARELLRRGLPARRQLPFTTPPMVDNRAPYGGYGNMHGWML